MLDRILVNVAAASAAISISLLVWRMLRRTRAGVAGARRGILETRHWRRPTAPRVFTEQEPAAPRTRERGFQPVADSAPVMIWITDVRGQCTWVNRPWLEFTGRTMEQEIGEGWASAIHLDDVEVMARLGSKAVAERTRFTLEYRLRRRDGEYRWLEASGSPQYEDDGTFTGFIGTCLDVTDHKLTEERLLAADRVKDEFLATLAHELRNPLAPIRTALAVIQQAPAEDEESARAREIIARQIGSMTRLVDDLLDVSRITRGIVPLRRECVRLDAVIADAIEANRPRIEGERHELQVRLPGEPLTLDADPMRLAQVLGNLLDNAAKYTPRGGRIELAARREGEEAVVTVRDNGVGIPSDQIPHVFDMFSRGSTGDLGRGGLGIGLWLARKLAELHGGSVRAVSGGSGHGTEMVVRLPLVPAMEAESRPPRSETTPAARSQGMRVLVVEDNADAAESMDMLLRRMGHDVRLAGDGRTGLQLAETAGPDIVLLDLGLPELNGFEVARRIRLQPWGERMVLVALTGWGQDDDRRRSREAGFDHHLVKPVDPAALGALLESLRTLVQYR